MKTHSRQFLRLIAVTSVRNSLETRYSSCEIESECQKPISKLLQTMCNINSAVIDLHLLLQDQDVNRLRQTVYRDLDDQKNSEFLALASVYLGPFSKKNTRILIHFRFDLDSFVCLITFEWSKIEFVSFQADLLILSGPFFGWHHF